MVWAMNFSERRGIVNFINENKIRIINLCHIPEDGRLKTLSFSATKADRVNEILEFGERVDGSNLFSCIETGKSDIYIAPDEKRAFVDPFSTLPTLNLLCDYLDENGKPLDIAPKNILLRAEQHLLASKKISLKALAELEFYIVAKKENAVLFHNAPDKNYHESPPFTNFEDVRNEILATLDLCGMPTKYGHCEVGLVYGDDGTVMEQHEIEFKPRNLVRMAETISVAKWIARNVCARHGLHVTFVPKIDMHHAGSGMHIHLYAVRDGKNIVPDIKNSVSHEALEIIGGMLRLAPSLSAFGNPTPVSYLRFCAHKESPMQICWGAQNRLALIRIPLWWGFKKNQDDESSRKTFEYRAPDAFANAYLLFAGLAVAAEYGMENSKESLKLAEKLYIGVAEKRKDLPKLPSSCFEAAKKLEEDSHLYVANSVFPERLIDETVKKLNTYVDSSLKQNSGRRGATDNIIREFLDYA
jgi:glutamine synthetase